MTGKIIEKYIAELKPHEMALRLAEAATNLKRDPLKTAEANMLAIKKADPDAFASFYRMALAAAQYLEEAINDYQRVN
jgi:hypothetical protein